MATPTRPTERKWPFIQGGGAISQDITFAEAGSYTISFQSAYRQYGGQHSFMVLVDGVSIGTFTPDSLEFQGYSATFSVTAGTHRITFRGLNEGGDKTAFIDHVSIAKTSSLVQVSLSVDHRHAEPEQQERPDVLQRRRRRRHHDDVYRLVGRRQCGARRSAVHPGRPTTTERPTCGSRRTIWATADIGGPKSSTSTVAINVLAVNDPPLNTVPSTTQGTYGNQPIVFSTAGVNAITVGDHDAGNIPIQVTLTVSHGTLTLNGTQG